MVFVSVVGDGLDVDTLHVRGALSVGGNGGYRGNGHRGYPGHIIAPQFPLKMIDKIGPLLSEGFAFSSVLTWRYNVK